MSTMGQAFNQGVQGFFQGRANEQAYQSNEVTRKAQKQEFKDYNSPDARRGRAEQLKLQSQQRQVQSKQAEGADAYFGNMLEQFAQKEQEYKNKTKVAQTFSTLYTDVNKTGKFTNFTGINEAIDQSPLLKEQLPYGVSQYNAEDTSHIANLSQMATNVLKAQGRPESEFNAKLAQLKKNASNGLITFDRKTGQALPMDGFARMVQANKLVAKSDLDSFNTTMGQVFGGVAVPKTAKGKENAQDSYTELARLKQKESETPLSLEESIQKLAIEKDLKIYTEGAQEWLTSEASLGIRTDLANNAYESLTRTNVDEAKRKEVAAGVKYSDKNKEETTLHLDVIKNGTAIVQTLQKYSDEEIMKGYKQDKALKIKTQISDGSFAKLSHGDQKAALLTVMADSQIGIMFSKYVKSISGAAVSEQEFVRLAKNLFGGDPEKVNMYTIKQAFTTFINETRKGMDNKIATYANDLPGTMGNYALQLKEIPTLDTVQMPGESGPDSVSQTADETIKMGAKILTEETSSATGAVLEGVAEGTVGKDNMETLKEIGSNLYDAVTGVFNSDDTKQQAVNNSKAVFNDKMLQTISTYPKGQRFKYEGVTYVVIDGVPVKESK